MPEDQAVAIVNEQLQLIADTLATKDDLRALEQRLLDDIGKLRSEVRSELAEVRSEVRSEMAGLRTEMAALHGEVGILRADMQAMESRLTGRLGGLMIGLAAALTAVIAAF